MEDNAWIRDENSGQTFALSKAPVGLILTALDEVKRGVNVAENCTSQRVIDRLEIEIIIRAIDRAG